ncbi:hypothetical protein [Microvirga sesbaniae]|uniref:hypothetical protein n=1 Tax=Microvirga sesbaniae TaxID=681392 RepID=UPI0021CAA99E|nr:hypothetical protein [Microvirga sp. HBU67692]
MLGRRMLAGNLLPAVCDLPTATQDSDLAKKLSDPIAALNSVPLQLREGRMLRPLTLKDRLGSNSVEQRGCANIG